MKGGFEMKNLQLINRILLGLVMLIPGLAKLFAMGGEGVSAMLSGIALFSWAPLFWAWVLILSEILFGIAILAKWKLEWTVIPPMIILLVSAFTVHWGNWPNLLIHLVVVSNYSLIAGWEKGKKKRK